MFLKTLVRAINTHASAIHDLASAIRGQQSPISDPNDLPEVENWRETDHILEAEDRREAETPAGSVFYHSEDATAREEELQAIKEYWESRRFVQSEEEGSLVVPISRASDA